MNARVSNFVASFVVNVVESCRQSSRQRIRSWLLLLSLVAVSGSLSQATAETPAPFTADLSQSDVQIRLTAEPAQVRMDRDLILTLQITAPSHLNVTLPDLRERFRGFRVADGFVTDPVTANGSTRTEQHWRLTPDLMRTYRLAPFAVQVADTRTPPPRITWFATRPVIFPAEPAPPAVAGAPEVNPKPFWIAPTPRMVLEWIALGLLMLAGGVGAWFALRLLQRQARERRLSPRERALAELDRLLRRNLPAKHLYKDFYIELTMVVRRYIERAHVIRAPEQTTEEFLAAAARHPHFTPEVLAHLRRFLESADLVKFAGQEATPQTADEAAGSARRYVEEDAAQEKRNK